MAKMGIRYHTQNFKALRDENNKRDTVELQKRMFY